MLMFNIVMNHCTCKFHWGQLCVSIHLKTNLCVL